MQIIRNHSLRLSVGGRKPAFFFFKKDPMMSEPQGLTTKQMMAAPQRALYIWPVASSISYARALAHHIGRHDLAIVSPSVLRDGGDRLRGLQVSAIICDHGFHPTDQQLDVLDWIKPYIVKLGRH